MAFLFLETAESFPLNMQNRGGTLMSIDLHLKSNNKIIINFGGGDLSSDSGLLLILLK